MNRQLSTMLLILLGALQAAPAGAQCRTDLPRTNRGGKINWRQDIQAAFGDAARQGRPIVIYFTADW